MADVKRVDTVIVTETVEPRYVLTLDENEATKLVMLLSNALSGSLSLGTNRLMFCGITKSLCSAGVKWHSWDTEEKINVDVMGINE